jgi:hypothetical protein
MTAEDLDVLPVVNEANPGHVRGMWQFTENGEFEEFSGRVSAGVIDPHSLSAGQKWVFRAQLIPTPENNDIYCRLTVDDPDMSALIKSVRERGIIEPIHASTDGRIISGHRRVFAAGYAGVRKVPVIVHPISYRHDRNEFLRALVECNTQRKKTTGMQIREEIAKIDGKVAIRQIQNDRKEIDYYRRYGSCIADSEITPVDIGKRDPISDNKMPMLRAAIKVLSEHRQYWPLSVRQVHYRLLNDPPLRHAKKAGSTYKNDKQSYKDLTDILARGRIQGLVSFDAIDDETRPEEINRGSSSVGAFFKQEIQEFLKGYWRNRQQSQENQVEIIAEKLTVRPILSSVANEYGIPLTINRGMSGPTVKYKIAQRFRRSGKRKLIILAVFDLDPAGDAIAEDIRKSFERDFDIFDIEVYKAALTIEQVKDQDLTPSMDAKESSPTYTKFCEKYDTIHAWELEALDPGDLQEILEDAIQEVIDLGAYNEELAAEENDSVKLVALKNAVLKYVQDIDIDALENLKAKEGAK